MNRRRSYRRLTWHNRSIIMNMSKAGKSQKDIALVLGVSVATVSRELRRNVSIYGYIAIAAELMARIRRCLVKRHFKIKPAVLDIIKKHLHKKRPPECIAIPFLKLSCALKHQ